MNKNFIKKTILLLSVIFSYNNVLLSNPDPEVGLAATQLAWDSIFAVINSITVPHELLNRPLQEEHAPSNQLLNRGLMCFKFLENRTVLGLDTETIRSTTNRCLFIMRIVREFAKTRLEEILNHIESEKLMAFPELRTPDFFKHIDTKKEISLTIQSKTIPLPLDITEEELDALQLTHDNKKAIVAILILVITLKTIIPTIVATNESLRPTPTCASPVGGYPRFHVPDLSVKA